jgi:O-antigen/teichoic acid export membrane protein
VLLGGPSGARSGALVAAASLVATAANYVFLLAAGRLLGSDDYGSLAALLGALTVVLLPTGALQLAVSREVSRRLAGGDRTGAEAFSRAIFRLALIATVPLLALSFLLVAPVAALLKIDSAGVVALAAAGLAVAFAFPVALGVLQGYQRFHAVAALYVVPFALRLAFLAGVAALGFRLGGAVYSAVAGGVVGAAVAATLIEQPLRRAAHAARPALAPFLRYLGPVVLGLIGVAVLTNADVLVVKARFSPAEAGDYAAASAFAKVAFFLPATILAVLFPRTAARQARGEETEDILGRSLIVVTAFCALLALGYAMAGRGLIHSSFGAEFAEGGELVVPLTLAMTLYTLANILVGFHLSRGEKRFAWIVAASVPAQVLLLSLVPFDLHGVIWTNVAVGLGLLVAHELLVGSSARAIRAGARHLREGATVRRQHLAESALVLGATSLFVGLLTWPMTSRLGSAFIGTEGSDSAGGIAAFWQQQKEGGYHVFGTTRHVLTGAPFGWDEANGLHLQSLLPYYPGYLLTKVVGEVAAWNLVVLSGYVLSGVTMYVVARYLGCSRLVCGWAALAYIVFPWHLERAQHGALVHVEVLALLVLALLAAFSRPSWLRYGLVSVAALACWLTFGYFGVMATIGAAAFAFGAFAAARSRRRSARVAVGTAGAALAAMLVMGVFTLAPGVDRGESLERDVLGLSVYGLRPSELVVPPARNIVVGDLLEDYQATRLHGSNVTEATNYVGVLTIALAIGWLVVAFRRRRRLSGLLRAATGGLVALAVAGVLFGAPSPLSVFGDLWTWTPSRVLFEFVSAFRAPSRWSVVIMTALVPLAALCLQVLRTVVARRRRIVGVALVVAASLFSFLELTIPPASPTASAEPPPPQYATLAALSAGILAEYPLKPSTISIFWQRVHGRPLLNGASPGTYANDVARTLVDPSARGTAGKLAYLGVTAILTRPGALDYKSESTPDVPDASWGPGYALLGRYADGTSLWRVTAPAAPVLPIYARDDFADPLDPEQGFVGYPLGGSSGRIELTARSRQTVRLSCDAVPTGSEPLTLLLTGADGSATVRVEGRTRVSAVVDVPAGGSGLVVAVDPTPEAGVVPVNLSAPWTEPATGAAAVRAEPRR